MRVEFAYAMLFCTMLVYLLVTLALLGFLFLVGVVRAAFFLLSPSEVGLMRARRDFYGQQIAYLHEDQRGLLITFLWLQALAMAGIGTAWGHHFLLDSAQPLAVANSVAKWLSLSGIGLAIPVLGFVLPAVVASAWQQTILNAYAFWVLVASKLLQPLTAPFKWFAEQFGFSPDASILPAIDTPSQANEGIDQLAEPGNTGVNDETDILRGIARFSSIPVRQIMTSRMDMVPLQADMTHHQVMDTINKSGYSRYPVYALAEEEDGNAPEKVSGILFVKDLLPHIDKDEHFDWLALLRPVYFSPATKRIDGLLRSFQEQKTHLAIVLDEYGGVQGLVTMEDILEEIVGEIQDEFDGEEQSYKQVEPNVWEFEGRAALNDLFKVTDTPAQEVDDIRGNAETVAGLLLEVQGTMPKAGQKIQLGPFLVTVLAGNKRMIKRVRIEMAEEE